MKCPKCNSKFKGKLKFCPRCGLLFDSKVVDNYREDLFSYYIEPYIYSNFETNGNPKSYYFLFGWFYAIMKRMYRTTIYLFLWFLFLLYLIKNWDGVILLFIRLYPIGILFLIILVTLFVKYYVTLLSKFINNDIIYKCKKIMNSVKDNNKEKINELIIEDNKNNYILLTLSIIFSIILIFLIFI